MIMAGSMNALAFALAVTTSVHHTEAVKFDSLQPTVVRSTSGNLELTMTMTPQGDQSSEARLVYEMDYRNISRNLIVNLIIQNPIPASTQFRVGSSTPGTPPESIMGVTPQYSRDGGTTWTYVPVSGGGGAPEAYDANVTHVRFVMSGVLTPGMTCDSGVGFSVRIATD